MNGCIFVTRSAIHILARSRQQLFSEVLGAWPVGGNVPVVCLCASRFIHYEK
jgi:hypothetical protein